MNAIHQRISELRAGATSLLLSRMPSGWAVLNHAYPDALKGCCMLLADLPRGGTPAHLHELDDQEQAMFLRDLARLNHAVLSATRAERVNILILCNQAPSLHAHCIPRYPSEDARLRMLDPFSAYTFCENNSRIPEAECAEILTRLRQLLA